MGAGQAIALVVVVHQQINRFNLLEFIVVATRT